MKSILTMFTLVFLLALVSVIIVRAICDKLDNERTVRSEEELMYVIERTMEREVGYKLNDFALKNIRIIKDFELELNELVTHTLIGLSPEFRSELRYYYTDEYLTRIVNKYHKTFLLNFMNEKKIKTK